ncbi:diversity-generating retroelement protein Avd [Deltaproteobacteria bacterium TL4]
MPEELPLFTHWMEFVSWLLNTTEKCPKRLRFTLTQRIENHALDIVEELVQARYSKGVEKKQILQRINLTLERLRILLRLGFQQQALTQKQYEYALRQIQEAGKMVGGWSKQQGAGDSPEKLG